MTTTQDGQKYGQERGVRWYRAVPAFDLETVGVVDLIRTPTVEDGVDRAPKINWAGARFAVRAVFDGRNPHHQVTIDYLDEESETGRSHTAVSIDLGNDGLPEAVATVSGGHSEGMGRLSDEQRLVLSQLIQRSIQTGEDL